MVCFLHADQRRLLNFVELNASRRRPQLCSSLLIYVVQNTQQNKKMLMLDILSTTSSGLLVYCRPSPFQPFLLPATARISSHHSLFILVLQGGNVTMMIYFVRTGSNRPTSSEHPKLILRKISLPEGRANICCCHHGNPHKARRTPSIIVCYIECTLFPLHRSPRSRPAPKIRRPAEVATNNKSMNTAIEYKRNEEESLRESWRFNGHSFRSSQASTPPRTIIRI